MEAKPIRYRINAPVSPGQYIELLHQSGLAEHRPVHDMDCIRGMLQNSNLVVTAWNKEELVGIARSVTDFHYACYLSDIAVSEPFQGMCIGTRLQMLIQQQLGHHCKMILMAPPAIQEYCHRLGYEKHPAGMVLNRNQSLSEAVLKQLQEVY